MGLFGKKEKVSLKQSARKNYEKGISMFKEAVDSLKLSHSEADEVIKENVSIITAKTVENESLEALKKQNSHVITNIEGILGVAPEENAKD